jgi:uncharacterized protein (TIGR03790 family)
LISAADLSRAKRLLLLACAAVLSANASAATPLPQRLDATDLAVVVNTADPLSVKIGNYYARKRHIPAANIVRVHFAADRDGLPPEEFAPLKATVEQHVGRSVQAYALTWARPYRVGCMSITSAFAFGFDPKYCATGCHTTSRNPYFNSGVAEPYTELKFRPTMSIAALDFDHARALIDRGVRSDGTQPHGTAYLVVGNDADRNARASEYPVAEQETRDAMSVDIVQGTPLERRQDVMFYFVGAVSVPGIDTNRFLPGAVADHLTSFGGMLTDSPQMSSLRWLEAGATGSYGTVVEPCAFPQKFPDVTILMSYYMSGETLIEAYWKSVQMPGQGLFIGEPLAAPFRSH